MKLIFNEDQRMLQDTVQKLVQTECSVDQLRRYRDDRDLAGYSETTWKQLAELGFLGLNFPEAYGGSELGFRELCLMLEALGGRLTPEPVISTVVLAGQTILQLGSDAQKQEWLTQIAEGNLMATLAIYEAGHSGMLSVEQTKAAKSDRGYKLNGTRQHVWDGHLADLLFVPAELDGKLTVFAVTPDTQGVTITRQHQIDGRNTAIVELNNVALDANARLGTGDATQALEKILDLATIALSAEMLGSALAAFDITLAYLKERVQFGVPIGSFQALQHRAAQMFIDLQLSTSAVMGAAAAADEAPENVPAFASLAKAKISETFELVAKEGVQMHGGVGVTDEYDIGFYLKRARATAAVFGNADWHKSRWAELQGY